MCAREPAYAGRSRRARSFLRSLTPVARVPSVIVASRLKESSRTIDANSSVAKSWIEFSTADAMKLPFDDSSFDYVRAERVLIHLSDARRGLEEMIRVVARGGRVVTSEIDLGTAFLDLPMSN